MLGRGFSQLLIVIDGLPMVNFCAISAVLNADITVKIKSMLMFLRPLLCCELTTSGSCRFDANGNLPRICVIWVLHALDVANGRYSYC